MWIDDLYCIKFKSISRHKAIYNCAMPYLMALIISSFKFLGDLKKNQINLWPKRNSMALDRTIIEVWNK